MPAPASIDSVALGVAPAPVCDYLRLSWLVGIQELFQIIHRFMWMEFPCSYIKPCHLHHYIGPVISLSPWHYWLPYSAPQLSGAEAGIEISLILGKFYFHIQNDILEVFVVT